MNENADLADPFGQIADAFVEEFRQGRRPSLEEYARRFPEHASDIRDILPTLVMMERAKSLSGSLNGERPCATDSAPLLGRELGDYRIVREIGRGGMGVVYEAEQVSLGRRVAVKVLAQQALAESKQRRRFEREARAAAKLHHTNIVPVFGVGEQDGLCYYAMQFIRGLGLDKVLEELKRTRADSAASGRSSRGELRVERCSNSSAAIVAQSLLSGEYGRADLSSNHSEVPMAAEPPCAATKAPSSSADAAAPPETFTLSEDSAEALGQKRASESTSTRVETYWHSIARIGVQVAEALQYAHDQGITHRDIKPSNLLLDLRGTVWVTDFGLAKSDDQQNLTHTGDILGTLRYLPPEAFDGRSDTRSDVYSLGLTLYELLTLRPAFDETERYRLVKKVTTGAPPRIDRVNAEVPRDLATIVHRAMERDPPDRYQTAGQLAADLERFIHDEPIHARRASLVEQVRRWSRRNRSLAAAMLGIAALLLVLASGATLAAIHFRQQEEFQRQLLRQSESLALHNERLAEENRRALETALETSRKLDAARAAAEKQEDITRRHLYCAQMAVAYRSWQQHRGMLRTQSLLDEWRPKPKEQDLRGWEWYFIHGLCHRELAAFAGHTDAVTCVAYSPSGQRLASAGRDGAVRIWDEQERALVRTLAGHRGVVNSVCFGADESRLVSAADDGVRVWDVAHGECVQRLAAGRAVAAVAYSPDGQLLALAVREGAIELWNARTWELARALAGHVTDVYTETISFSPDGTQLAAPGNRRVLVWNVQSGQQIHNLTGHNETIQATVFSPDGTRIASSSRDATIRIWESRSGRQIDSLTGHTHGIAAIAWHPNEDKLASGAWDGTCRVWDLAARQEVGMPRGHARHVFSVAWRPDGTLLASGGDDNLVKLWDPSRFQETAVLTEAAEPIQCLGESPDGALIATGFASGGVSLWDAATGEAIRTLSGQHGMVRSVAFHPRGDQLAAACDDGHVVIWNPISGDRIQTIAAHASAVISVSWNATGTQFVSTSRGGEIILWDATTGQRIRQLLERSRAFELAEFSPDCSRLAAIGSEGTLRVWNLVTGERQVLGGSVGRVNHLAWSANSLQLATAGDDRTVRLWDLATAKELLVLTGHREVIGAVDFSDDGRRLLSGDSRGTIKLWDLATGVETLTLHGAVGRLSAAGWTRDGLRIVATSDSKVLAWDAKTGYQLEQAPAAAGATP